MSIVLAATRHELSLRAFVLGIALTVILTAANVYLGLKAGLTFSTSIPAAVLSMGLFSALGRSNALENNIVQIIASGAGAQASIIFVLPAFVMGGFLTGFPFWPMVALTAASGVLGVLFTVPLRRAMVVNSDLPYPEGVAGAEILRLGDPSAPGRSRAVVGAGARALIAGTVISAAYPILIGIRLLAGGVSRYARIGPAVTGGGVSFSLALIGAGYLIGAVGTAAMLVGVVLAWGVAVPLLSAHATIPDADLGAFANHVWRSQVRLFGVGVIAVAALWMILTLLRPVASGIAESIRLSRLPRGAEGAEGRDLPPVTLAVVGALSMALLAYVFQALLPAGLGVPQWAFVLGLVLVSAVLGAIVAASAGYMAGLVGSSSSPISGLGLIGVITASLLLLGLVSDEGTRATAMLAALVVTAAVLGAASSSNDNLQDLKTGHLLGASPWRQQVALLVGVVAAAPIVSPVLEQLYRAYGFVDSTLPGQDPAKALAAPQGALMLATARGILSGDLRWDLIGAGAALGAALIVIDRALRRHARALPPLAVALGIYLPIETTLPLILGGMVGWAVKRRLRGGEVGVEQVGVLAASGLIVGESLVSVLIAFLVGATGRDEPLALLPKDFAPWGEALGALTFAGALAWLYRRGVVTGPARRRP